MAAQNRSPVRPTTTSRAWEPARSCRSRASTPRHFGVRMVQSAGWLRLPVPALGIENGIELVLPESAGQFEEEVLEAEVARGGLIPQLRHRAERRDASVVHDGDAVAHLLRD